MAGKPGRVIGERCRVDGCDLRPSVDAIHPCVSAVCFCAVSKAETRRSSSSTVVIPPASSKPSPLPSCLSPVNGGGAWRKEGCEVERIRAVERKLVAIRNIEMLLGQVINLLHDAEGSSPAPAYPLSVYTITPPQEHLFAFHPSGLSWLYLGTE